MGKKLKDEDLVLNIIVNGDKGRSEIKQLERALTDTKLQLTALEAERRKLTASGKQNTLEWQANEKAIQQAKNAISQAEERLKLLRNGMKLTDMSIRDLQREQLRLTALMKTSVPGSENWMRYRNDLKLVQNRLREVGGESQRAGISIGKTADKFNRYMGIATAFAGTVTVGVMGLRKANQAYAEYDDKLADVMKTTGLTKEQTEGLSAELAKVDTRTSQNELLDLARQAGKLGISAETDVEKFVLSADKIGVALGEDLGGKEAAINTMGKLVDLFKIKDEYGMADGMLKVGSAVNALGAASTANEGYIVDFTSRVGGIAVSSNMTAANVMGLAATFDSLNAQSEASATVVNKVVVGMFKNSSQYAKVAGMDLKSFTNLLKTDVNEALLRVLGGFKGTDLGVTAGLLGEVGENGARAAQAVALISENIGMVREQQVIANEEFIKGTGVIDEFNTKNSTAQAQLDKAQKGAQQRLVELGEMIQPLMSGIVTGFSMVIKGLTATIKFFIEYKAVIIGITVATLMYIATQQTLSNWDKITAAGNKLKAFWGKAERKTLLDNTKAMVEHSKEQKAKIVSTVKYTLAQKAMAFGQALVTLNFKAMGLAAKSFWMSLGPVGWAATAVGVLAGVLTDLYFRTKDAVKAKQEFDDAHSKVDAIAANADALRDQKSKMTDLIKTYNELYPKTNKSQEENEKLRKTIADIVKIMPSAATKFDEYGRAVAISTNKVTAAYEAERKYFLWKNQDVVDDLVEGAGDRLGEISNLNKNISDSHDNINIVGNKKYQIVRGTGDYNSAKKYLVEQQNQLRQNTELLYGYVQEMERMGMTAGEIAARISKDAGVQFTESALSNFKNVFETVMDSPKTTTNGSTIGDGGDYGGGSGDNKQKWSLDNDERFSKARIELKLKLFNGEIATEQEHDRQLLALEISTLEQRLATGKEKGEERLKLLQELANRQYNQRKSDEARLQKLQEIADSGKSVVEQERIRYDKQLKDLGLFGIEREQMTELQLEALVALEKQHIKKISSLHFNSLSEQFDDTKKALQEELTTLKVDQGNELSAVKSFEDKKFLLKRYYSVKELRQITTDKEADKAIKAAYQKEEIEVQQKHLKNMLMLYQSMIGEYQSKGTIFGKVITDEDAEKLNEMIANLKKQLADLGVNIEFTPEKGQMAGVDILGMTPDGWETLFKNLKTSKGGLEEWSAVVGAIGQAVGQTFGEVSNLMTSIEQRELKSYEKAQNKKKQALEKQLKAGTISQENYNARIQQLDSQTEAEQEEAAQKQAKRQKMMAIFQVLLNTAMAIMSTSAQLGYPAAIPFVAAVGVLGAIQLAAIIAQPLPGAEKGGILVERTQDGKRFNAAYSPKKRGRIDNPTVIVGENGAEYVVPAEGYDNPTIRPVLDIIEAARINGTLKQLDLSSIVTASHPGRAKGGYVDEAASTTSVATNTGPTDRGADTDTRAMISELTIALRLLNEKLPHIKAYVTYTGRGGVLDAQKRYDSIPKDL